MDLSRIKNRDPAVAIFPGSTFPIGIRPLPQNKIDDARARAQEYFAALGVSDKYHLGLWLGGEILSCALTTVDGSARWTPSEIRAACSPQQLSELLDLWREVQNASEPKGYKLEAEIELQCAEGVGDAVSDIGRAVLAGSAVAYYGDPVSDLTDGQLSYYATLRSVHNKRTEGSGNRCVSLEMLERKAGRRRRHA